MREPFVLAEEYAERTREQAVAFQEREDADYWCSKPFRFQPVDDEELPPVNEYPKPYYDYGMIMKYFPPKDLENFGVMHCSFYRLNSIGDWIRGGSSFKELWESLTGDDY